MNQAVTSSSSSSPCSPTSSMDNIPSTSSLNMTIRLHNSPEAPPSSTSPSSPPPTLYFGYGSNLWRDQMRRRCPTSEYIGIARLKGYKWIIYDRGYANIVKLEIDPSATAPPPDEDEDTGNGREGDTKNNNNSNINDDDDDDTHDYTHEVWGLVYSLQASDELALDGNEGVPIAYQKAWIECELWSLPPSSSSAASSVPSVPSNLPSSSSPNRPHHHPNLNHPPTKTRLLVYINHHLTRESPPKEEYIYRMNRGIRDALGEGVPRGYVERVMRRFIPERGEGEVDGEVRRLAERQGGEFREGRGG